MSLKAITYVCVVSDHNLPELEAILNYLPKTVILIATKGYEKQANRLKSQILQAPGFGTALVLLADTKTLTGNTLSNSQKWVKQHLVGLLEQHQAPYFLNLTGGTKPLAIALLYGYLWEECHYKAFGSKSIERFKIVEQQPQVLPDLDNVAHAITVNQAVGLYCETQSIISAPPCMAKQTLAKKLWQALDQQDIGLKSLFTVLDQIWSKERDKEQWKEDFITLGWDTFEQIEYVMPWLTELQSVDEVSMQVIEAGVKIPGNKRANNSSSKQAAQFKTWVAGGWLEDVVYSWLGEVIPSQQLAINLQTQTSDDPYSQREVDILLLHNGRTWVMEIKADLPPNQSLSDLENQLSGGARRYGKTQKVLFIGPELKQKLEREKRLEGFAGRCRGNQVALCYSKQNLYNVLGI